MNTHGGETWTLINCTFIVKNSGKCNGAWKGKQTDKGTKVSDIENLLNFMWR